MCFVIIIVTIFTLMSKPETEEELKALKSKVKDPAIKKAIEEKLKAIKQPVLK